MNEPSLQIEPDIGVPLHSDVAYDDLFLRAQAACNTALHLKPFGLDVEPTENDKVVAATLVESYASDQEVTSKAVTETRASDMTPASLMLVTTILDEFGKQVVHSSLQIRNLITNKLLLDSDHADPRVRLRAIELLGKISDVSMFTEKRELTVTHKSAEELRADLKTKLHRMMRDGEEVVEAEVVTEPPAD